MTHAERCPVCERSGEYCPPHQRDPATCHGCGGKGWVTVYDSGPQPHPNDGTKGLFEVNGQVCIAMPSLKHEDAWDIWPSQHTGPVPLTVQTLAHFEPLDDRARCMMETANHRMIQEHRPNDSDSDQD